MSRKILFSPPHITDLEISEVIDTLKSGWITTGPKTKQLERDLADFCNTNRLVCLNSATAAMELTLMLLGVGPGDEVITSAYTYTASASVITHVGATPVLIDTQKDTFEMDYQALEAAINSKTKVIIPIDIAGVMCDYDKIFEIVERKRKTFNSNNDLQSAFGRVIIMADAAHSLGATYKGKMSGQVADFTCFSFHAVKNFTTAEGGAVTWKDVNGFDNEWIYNQFMLLALHGQNKDALSKSKSGGWEYDIIFPGYKCNLTDIGASLGLAQLKRYNDILSRRRQIVELYNEKLNDDRISFLNHYFDDNNSSGHLYFVRIKGINEQQRNEIIVKMSEKGITCNVHYKPLPMLTAYKNLGFDIGEFPNSYDYYHNIISLPLHTLLSDEDVIYVADALKSILLDY